MPLYPQLVEHFELKVEKGAWVQLLNPGGPAEQAGVRGGSGQEAFQGAPFARGGDVITKVGGHRDRARRRPLGAIARFKPGETVTSRSTAAARRRRVDVKLGERRAGPRSAAECPPGISSSDE